MDAANIIRESMETVAALRARSASQPRLGAAVAAIKRMQAARFRGCYADLMQSSAFAPASCFFLEELYSEADFSQRDRQFARIAGTLATVFPASVVATAVALSQLHALTEELDHRMALQCEQHMSSPSGLDAVSYVSAWQEVGRRGDRQRQLDGVLALGHDLADLTTKPGLALLLKLMRRPAATAGMASLQQFLERGFGIFAGLARNKGRVGEFLSTIEKRESLWLDTMFDNPADEAALALARFIN
jgi:hypothetical protein